MATTVFGEDLSEHSSLLSEGSAIAQIERELQDVVSQGRPYEEERGERREREEGEGRKRATQHQLSSMANFTTPPLHFDPSDVSSEFEDDDLSDSAAPQSSTGYIPTALEQRR